MMTPSQFSERVLEILDRQGWCQGRLQDKQGRLCLLGAGMVVGRIDDVVSLALWFSTLDLLLTESDYPHHDVISFNNDPHTTFEDVQLILKRSIAEAPV